RTFARSRRSSRWLRARVSPMRRPRSARGSRCSRSSPTRPMRSTHSRTRIASLLEIATLDEDVLGQPAKATDAHRRVLELDPSYMASYTALDRLYTAAEQWKELEELLARQADYIATGPGARGVVAISPTGGVVTSGDTVELMYRRAELFAHKLGDASRSVD